VEDDIRWKITFGDRQPSVEDDLWWRLLPMKVIAQLSPNWNGSQLSQSEIKFAIVEKCMQRLEYTYVQKRGHFYAKTT